MGAGSARSVRGIDGAGGAQEGVVQLGDHDPQVDYVMLARAMPDIIIGLALWSATGVVTSILWAAALSPHPHKSKP